MRRIWVSIVAIFAMSSVLLSACPMTPPSESLDRGGGGAGMLAAGTQPVPVHRSLLRI